MTGNGGDRYRSPAVDAHGAGAHGAHGAGEGGAGESGTDCVPEATTERWLVTGAAGRVGRLLRERLRRPGRQLRLLDREPVDDSGTDEVVVAALEDSAAVAAACAGVDVVVHLAAEASEHRWERILAVNVDGTRTLLEGARAHGVRRVVLASSVHAVGCWTRGEAGPDGLPADVPARPDTYYGWSKVAVEALGQLYAERYAMSVTALRIGTAQERPGDVRALATWLSPDDAARLVEAAAAVRRPGLRYVWGVSRNTRRWWSLREGERIGYHPRDDAEAYAAEVAAAAGGGGDVVAEVGEVGDERAGADWVERPLGEPMR